MKHRKIPISAAKSLMCLHGIIILSSGHGIYLSLCPRVIWGLTSCSRHSVKSQIALGLSDNVIPSPSARMIIPPNHDDADGLIGYKLQGFLRQMEHFLTDMSNRVEHQKPATWLSYFVQLGLRQTQELIKTKTIRRGRLPQLHYYLEVKFLQI